jgi:hypothetical protein
MRKFSYRDKDKLIDTFVILSYIFLFSIIVGISFRNDQFYFKQHKNHKTKINPK